MGTLHCALKNGADIYVIEHQKIRHYRARYAEERRKKKKKKEEEEELPNRDFFTLRGAYVKLRYIAMFVIHSFD